MGVANNKAAKIKRSVCFLRMKGTAVVNFPAFLCEAEHFFKLSLTELEGRMADRARGTPRVCCLYAVVLFLPPIHFPHWYRLPTYLQFLYPVSLFRGSQFPHHTTGLPLSGCSPPVAASPVREAANTDRDEKVHMGGQLEGGKHRDTPCCAAFSPPARFLRAPPASC